MAIVEQNDVLAVRQQALVSQADEHIALLTEYGKDRVAKCAEGRSITPELNRRMKMLVNQEYRLADMAKTIVRVCADIRQACADCDDVPQEALNALFEELEEYVTDLQDCNLQRSDNINRIIEGERESLQAFWKLRSEVDAEKRGVRAACLTTAVLIGLAAGPVTLVVGTGIALLAAAGHSESADKMQRALDEDIKRINAPIQYMETLTTNVEDNLRNTEMNRGRLAAAGGRSARVLRRVDLLLEEIQVVRRTACQNFVCLAGNETLAAGFGFTEHKRLLVMQQDVRKDAADVATVGAAAA